MKKRDEAKIAKGREGLEEAKRTYEMLNSELHDELPALHDSRILFLVTNLQSMFNAEHTFHTESAKVSRTYLYISDYHKGILFLKKNLYAFWVIDQWA